MFYYCAIFVLMVLMRHYGLIKVYALLSGSVVCSIYDFCAVLHTAGVDGM